MASSSIHIPARSVLSQVTMHVHVDGVRLMGFRIRLGCLIVKLAALVMGCGLRVEVEK